MTLKGYRTVNHVECPYCGNNELVANILIRQNAEVLEIGLSYETQWGLTGTEQVLADLCTKCGSVIRFHVSCPNRKWNTQG